MSTPSHPDLFDHFRAGTLPPPTQVGPGIDAVALPLAGSALRSVTVYLVRCSAGVVLVDAGYRHRSCWSALDDALKMRGYRVQDIVAVLLTHNHPDHIGLAEQVRAESGAEIVIHVGDDFTTQVPRRGGFLAQLRRALDESGAPPAVADSMYETALTVATHHEDLRADRVLVGEATLQYGDLALSAHPTPGHTPGHTCYLHPAGVLFTGDTFMPEGALQLALPSLPDDDPARDLLDTLALIDGLGADVIAPAHQYPFVNAAERAHELIRHHREELRSVSLMAGPSDTAWDLAPSLQWRKPWESMGVGSQRFALMHTLALLRAVRSDVGGSWTW